MASAAERAYEQWRLAYKLADDLLTRLEASERRILEELGCPPDPVAVFEILKGERPVPWPKATAARDRRRAHDAMMRLGAIPKIRGFIQFGHENAPMAAYWSVLAGLGAGESALRAVLREQRRRGGHTRGQQPRPTIADRQAKIRRAAQQWHASVNLQAQYALAPYVAEKTHVPETTVRRDLRRLELSAGRQVHARRSGGPVR